MHEQNPSCQSTVSVITAGNRLAGLLSGLVLFASSLPLLADEGGGVAQLPAAGAATTSHVDAGRLPGSAEGGSMEGSEIFHDYCSVCHGDRGDGRSRAQGSFFPPPRDFTHPSAADELSRGRMVFSVTYGRPNTAMAGWGKRLGPERVEAVVDYVRSAFMNIKEDDALQVADGAGAAGAEFAPGYMKEPMPYGIKGESIWGGMFYNENCADCHGENGDGKGPRSSFILPKPRDYRHPAARNKYNRPTLFEAIASGSHGSEMPAWDKVLTHHEIAHVTEYIYQQFIIDENGG
jgi:mono/diheme cytochrome c family protein